MPLAPPMRLHVRPGHARTVGAMLVVAALARPAHAQGGAQAGGQPRPAAATSAPTSGTLDGIVFDSLLTGAPLPGAEVWLEGTAHTAITGRGGRFRLADVPDGTHRLTFFHPSLEALGLTPAPRTVAVPGAAPVWLATPSYATVRRARCGAEEDGALLLARVGDDDGAVVPGAQVTVTWSAVGVNGAGLVRVPHERAATSDADGLVAVCGVPADGPLTVTTVAGERAARAEVTLAGARLGVRALRLPAASPSAAAAADSTSAAAGAAPHATARALAGALSVRVERADGTPIAGTEVALVRDGRTERVARTDSAGRAALGAVAPGTVSITARAVGGTPAVLPLRVAEGSAPRVLLTLGVVAQDLPTVRVAAERAARLGDATGFALRRAAGHGFFATRADLEGMRATFGAAALRAVPGAVVVPPGGPGNPLGIATFTRSGGAQLAGGCLPAFFVDGVRVASTLELPQAWPAVDEIEGIESYKSLATLPAQYAGLHANCGAILVWTRRGRAAAP